MSDLPLNNIVELLKHTTTVVNINTDVIKAQIGEIHRLEDELSHTKEIVENWLRLGSEHNELQTVFWDDDIVNLLKYLRDEEIE